MRWAKSCWRGRGGIIIIVLLISFKWRLGTPIPFRESSNCLFVAGLFIAYVRYLGLCKLFGRSNARLTYMSNVSSSSTKAHIPVVPFYKEEYHFFAALAVSTSCHVTMQE